MKRIIARMVPDWVEGYKGTNIPQVVFSTHPQFVNGTRLDYGFLRVALNDGYEVTIIPEEEQ